MSELRVDSVKSKGGGAPDLPKGVTISGITTAATLGATTVDVSNVNVSGVVTSGTLSGSLLSTGTPTLGLGVTINSSGLHISGVATAGIVSATTLYGDGSNLTGIGASIAPLFYNPDPSDTGVTFASGIGITFNQQVKAGTGNVTLSIANAGVAGTVVENFGVGSSVTISENKITIDPTADLSVGGDYIISYPSGCFTNNEGTDYVGTAYTFQARPYEYQLWSWGYNNFGGLGHNNAIKYSSPVQVPGTTWLRSGNTGLAKGHGAWGSKTDGTMWVWGKNGYGQLGVNNVVHVSSPIQLPGTTWNTGTMQIGEDNVYSSCAVKTDGTLWTWGTNIRGTLGQNQGPGQIAAVSSPVQVPGTTWSASPDTLGGNFNRMMAIKTDGTMWGWGYGAYGTMGLNLPDATYYSSPVQIPGTTWKTISVSSFVTMATKTDNTLWSWGYGGYGSHGPDRTNRSSPIQMPGTTWANGEGKMAHGLSNAWAIKTDGTLWAWGWNYYGALGQNQQGVPTSYSSPVQIPGTTWDVISVQGYTALARKTDGTLWAWGYGDAGGIGNDSNAHRSSPTQIGTDTDWTKVGSKQYANYAIKQI